MVFLQITNIHGVSLILILVKFYKFRYISMLPFHPLLHLICVFCPCISFCYSLIYPPFSTTCNCSFLFMTYVYFILLRISTIAFFVLFCFLQKVSLKIFVCSCYSSEWNLYFHWFTSPFQLLFHMLFFFSNICPDTNMSTR